MTLPQSAPPATFDPVLLAVVSKRLEGIAREMTNTLLRTGRSAILNTARDFSCSIVTADGRLLAAAEGLPIHIVGSEFLTRAMARLHPSPRAGDAFLHNDPYDGNTHHADHTILVPVLWGGEHLFTAVAKAHQADCGNGQPTTYAASARDVYEEGALNFPCVQMQRDYEHVDDIIRMCKRRIRVPDQWYGDYLATLGAARVGERGLVDLVSKYGVDTIKNFCREWFDYSERLMAAQISAMPAATIVGRGHHDPMPGIPDGVPLEVAIRIDPSTAFIDVDLTGNIDCVAAGYNLSEATAMASAIIGVCNQLPDPVPHNDGSFRRIRVHLRENCIAGIPQHPTSCSVATTNVADRIINITQAAFAQLGEGRGLAEGAVGQGPGMGVISGRDPRRGGAGYINQIYLASAGGPGAPGQDGWLSYGIPVCGGLMYRDSVEIAEQKYPMLVKEVRVLRDSEGAGRFRGAPGSRVTFGPKAGEMTVIYAADGHDYPPAGVLGGEAGHSYDVFMTTGGSRQALGTFGEVTLAQGETITGITNGGGGYGNPLDRDPDAVVRDVERGLVSIERAAAVYGVQVEMAADGRCRAAGLSAERQPGDVVGSSGD